MKFRKYRIYIPGKTIIVETSGEIKTKKSKKDGLVISTVEGDKIKGVILFTEIIEQEIVQAVKQGEEDDIEEV